MNGPGAGVVEAGIDVVVVVVVVAIVVVVVVTEINV